MPTLTVNGRTLSVDTAAETPLLWALREHLGLTGTKFGCGAGSAAPARCTWTARR
jgi:isoquinoline 1-oxidoreductase alpha subunit